MDRSRELVLGRTVHSFTQSSYMLETALQLYKMLELFNFYLNETSSTVNPNSMYIPTLTPVLKLFSENFDFKLEKRIL